MVCLILDTYSLLHRTLHPFFKSLSSCRVQAVSCISTLECQVLRLPVCLLGGGPFLHFFLPGTAVRYPMLASHCRAITCGSLAGEDEAYTALDDQIICGDPMLRLLTFVRNPEWEEGEGA